MGFSDFADSERRGGIFCRVGLEGISMETFFLCRAVICAGVTAYGVCLLRGVGFAEDQSNLQGLVSTYGPQGWCALRTLQSWFRCAQSNPRDGGVGMILVLTGLRGRDIMEFG